MYWKPHLAANARIARARNMWAIRTTPKISKSMKARERKYCNLTLPFLIRPRDHVHYNYH